MIDFTDPNANKIEPLLRELELVVQRLKDLKDEKILKVLKHRCLKTLKTKLSDIPGDHRWILDLPGNLITTYSLVYHHDSDVFKYRFQEVLNKLHRYNGYFAVKYYTKNEKTSFRKFRVKGRACTFYNY